MRNWLILALLGLPISGCVPGWAVAPGGGVDLDEATGTAAAWLAAGTLPLDQLGGWDLPTTEDDEPTEDEGHAEPDAGEAGNSGDTGEAGQGVGDNTRAAPALSPASGPANNGDTGSDRGARRGFGLRRLLGR